MSRPALAPRPSVLAAREAFAAATRRLDEALRRSPRVQELVVRLRAVGEPPGQRRRTAPGFPPFDRKEADHEES